MINLIYDTPAFRSELAIKYMISRYIKFLTIAKTKNNADPTLEMIPPLDIEVIWFSHAIRTKMYREDCQCLAGFIIGRTLKPDRMDLSNPGRLIAKDKWDALYKNEPFDLDLSDIQKLEDLGRQVTELPIQLHPSDVIRDLNWLEDFKKAFNFDRENFVQESIEDYFDYMDLLKQNFTARASLRVDLVWHTHMLNTFSYLNYAQHWFTVDSKIIDHCPWPDIENVVQTQKETEDIWQSQYGTKYIWKELNM